MTTRTTISLPDDLMSGIDALVGPRGRSGFFARAARNELKRERLRRALDAARGAMAGAPGQRSATRSSSSWTACVRMIAIRGPMEAAAAKRR